MLKRNYKYADEGGRDRKKRRVVDCCDDETECSVFVGNLNYSTKWQALKDHMRKAGNVDSANIMQDFKTGRSKGCGLVRFQNPREAQRAIRELNESTLEGRTIFVTPSEQQHKNSSGADSPSPMHISSSSSSVFVGNVSFDCSWQDLKDHFKRYGQVERAELPETPDGRKRGFGIVRFHNPEDAERAIRKLDGTSFQGRQIEVREDEKAGNQNSRTIEPAASVRTKNESDYSCTQGHEESQQLYVGNLSYDCTWQQLKDYFKRIGKVDHAEIAETSTGKKSGFGIVRYESSMDAKAAIAKLDGTEFLGRPLLVRWDRRPEKLEMTTASAHSKRQPQWRIETTDSENVGLLDGALSCPR